MTLHASFRHAPIRTLGAALAVALATGLAACGGDTDHPKTLDALRADADAVSAGREPASAPARVAAQASAERRAARDGGAL